MGLALFTPHRATRKLNPIKSDVSRGSTREKMDYCKSTKISWQDDQSSRPALRAPLSNFIRLCWNDIATFPFSCPLPVRRRGHSLRQLLQAPIYVVIIFRGLLRREGPGEGEE